MRRLRAQPHSGVDLRRRYLRSPERRIGPLLDVALTSCLDRQHPASRAGRNGSGCAPSCGVSRAVAGPSLLEKRRGDEALRTLGLTPPTLGPFGREAAAFGFPIDLTQGEGR